MPVYVLSSPTNLIDGEQSSLDSHGDNESGTSDIGLAIVAATDRERDYGGNQSSSSSSSSSTLTNIYSRSSKTSTTHHLGHNPIVREIKKHRRKQKSQHIHVDSGNDSSSTNATTPPLVVNPSQPQTNAIQEMEIAIKFRLSNGKEHRLYCKSDEKIRNIKRRLAMLENGEIDAQCQRLFFGGRLLRKRSILFSYNS